MAVSLSVSLQKVEKVKKSKSQKAKKRKSQKVRKRKSEKVKKSKSQKVKKPKSQKVKQSNSQKVKQGKVKQSKSETGKKCDKSPKMMSLQDDDDVFAFHPHPWQRKAIEHAEDMEHNGRQIRWYYSCVGEVGKSDFKKHVMSTFGALCVDTTLGMSNVKLAVLKIWNEISEKGDQFRENPIIVIDVPLALSKIVQTCGFYATIEDILGNFHSGKYQGGQVEWGDVSPKVIVFANVQPAVDKLSTDRLDVYLIDDATLDIRKDTAFDAKLAAQADEFKKAQAAAMAAIDSVPSIPPSDTKAFFESCYVLATPDRPAILSSDMHRILRRSGYNLSQKKMNEWLRQFFHVDAVTKMSTTHTVKEINKSHKVAWKGFKPKPSANAS
jgi:hypothetical protein